MRRISGIAGVFGVALIIGIGVWYARPIVQARRIGVGWWSTLHASRCRVFQGIERCTTGAPPPWVPLIYTTIDYGRRSRTIMRINRTWNLSDSSAWSRLLDSTRRALAADHRSPLPCDETVTRFPIAEAWRVGAQEIQLYATPAMPLYGIGTRAFLSVQLVPFGTGSCGRRYERRLLTPAEMEARVREWVTQQLGF